MQLILVRHGDAGAYTLPDWARNLSELGQSQAKQTAQWLTQFRIGQVISSPYNRAKQTAQILTDLPLCICDAITPDDDAKAGLLAMDALIDETRLHNNAAVLVVCHMNIIAKMADILTEEGVLGFGLAEARVFDLPAIGAGQAVCVQRFIPTVS